MPIRVLPSLLVNKIAAGEVIERPASIVKELVENALDAGATRIEIAVEDGGRRLVSVTDDGCGMSAEDAALSFAPHATSKIAGEDDLERIATMGFRGEALASIAAVSHARVRTRRREDENGWEVEASGQTLGEARPCAASPGTMVSVRDLFFNTPARRKFMRAPATEFGHVVEQLSRLALPHPQVAFRLTHNGREAQNLPAVASTLQRVGHLFGADLADGLLAIRPRGGDVQVSGLLGAPGAARASGKWQYFFLNGRFIRDRLLSHALREAFRGLVDPQRWPVAFVFVQMPPDHADVNVHPTKIEVRFRDSARVHGELLAALRETLNRSNLTPGAVVETVAAPQEPAAPAEAEHQGGEAETSRQQSLRQAMADFFRSAPRPQPRLDFPQTPLARHPAPSSRTGEAPASAASVSSVGQAPGVAAPPEPEQPAEPAPLPRGAAMQIHNAYLVSQTEDGLLIVDQHALHERLIYNDLKRRIQEGRLAAQRLLIPEVLPVTPAESDALTRHAPLLDRLGIEVVPFGPGRLAVQQFPALLCERGPGAKEVMRDLIDRLMDQQATEPEHLLEGVLEVLACKAAVKAGDPLGQEEMLHLLARREEAEKSSACPHGRPTALRITLKELQKQFKRA